MEVPAGRPIKLTKTECSGYRVREVTDQEGPQGTGSH